MVRNSNEIEGKQKVKDLIISSPILLSTEVIIFLYILPQKFSMHN